MIPDLLPNRIYLVGKQSGSQQINSLCEKFLIEEFLVRHRPAPLVKTALKVDEITNIGSSAPESFSSTL